MATWIQFEEGKSIGSVGSESGIIVKDEELDNSARVTIEKDGQIAMFSITLGIYGLAFHTNFYSTIDNAEQDFKWYKYKIEEILKLYDIEEIRTNDEWNKSHNSLIDELINR